MGLNQPPNPPTILTPKTAGYTLNVRCPIVVNVPSDTDGNTVQVRATFKNSGGTELCQVTSSFVTQGTGTVKLTPTLDLPVGTITVVLDAYDGTTWSTTNTYTFVVSSRLSFTVVSTDQS